MEGTQIASNLTRREQDTLFVLCRQHGIIEYAVIQGNGDRCYHPHVEGKVTKAQGVWLEAAIEGILAACRWGY